MVCTLTRASAALGVTAALALGANACGGGGQTAARAAEDRAQLSRTFGALPISFELNRGQHDRRVEFAARAGGASVFLTRRDAVIALRDQRLRMRLAGARPALVGERRLPGTANYLRGDDRRRWVTDVPTFGRVRYRRAWPGIDVTFRGDPGRGLEYDFELAPGADPDRIRIALDGHRSARVDARGDLVLDLGSGIVRARAPVAYQPAPGGRRTPVASRHVIRSDGSVGFAVGDHDSSRPLVIDPLLVYSTYLGGNDIDKALAVAVDPNGNAYVTGQTASTNFPKQAPFQASIGGGADAFITKINPAGNALVYSTYVGGSSFDEGKGIAVDTLGRAYVTGRTQSSNFPTANAGQAARSGDQDAFVVRLTAAGSALLYSTYHGGSAFDDGWAIAADDSGNAYVGGDTDSIDFPAVVQRQPNQPGTDGFVSKFNSSGALVYSTYHGGNGTDSARAIAVDDLGNAYVTGFTLSTSFPLANPLQTDATGGGEAFVSKLNPAGSALLYSTYLGGDDTDQGHGIAVDATRSAYVTGFTRSADFPATGPGAGGGTADVFIAKLAPAGGSLEYSTFIGGSSSDEGRAIAVDAAGSAHVTGFTIAHDFPLTAAFDTDPGGSNEEAFVAKLGSDGSVRYSSYLGGFGYDIGRGIGVDANGSAYVVGETGADDFPTVVPLQGQRASDPDAFVTRIDGSDETPPETTIDSGPPGRTQDRGATFGFSTSEPGAGAGFECKLDGGAFAACTTPAAFADIGEGEHTFQVRATDAYRNVDASPASFTWRVDLTAPVARLAAAPNPVTAGQPASFDASASSDPDGRITHFQFDLDGDTTFETDAVDQPRATRAYTAAGNIGVSVRVTDEVGLTSTAKVDLRVNPGPVVTPPPGPQREVRSSLDWSSRYTRRWTQLTRLIVKRVPADGRVTVRCKARGRRCPFKQRTFSGKTVKLTSRFRGRRFRRGDTLELRVTAPGAIGKQYLMTFRAGRKPSVRTRCLSATGASRRCPD